jgi:hypothetical protein
MAIVIKEHNLIIAGSLNVSFQRYPEKVLDSSTEVPRSYGALPVELTSSDCGFLPVREGEAIWLGLLPNKLVHCQVGWLGEDGTNDAPLRWYASLSRPEFLHGLTTAAGEFRPFIRFPVSHQLSPCFGVVISTEAADRTHIRFLSVALFEELTGRLAPRAILPNDCYGGWQLP